jgi:hypothetical protein
MMKMAVIIAAGSTTDTIDGATQIQTPSRAEHGLGGRFAFGKLRKKLSGNPAPKHFHCGKPVD